MFVHSGKDIPRTTRHRMMRRCIVAPLPEVKESISSKIDLLAIASLCSCARRCSQMIDQPQFLHPRPTAIHNHFLITSSRCRFLYKRVLFAFKYKRVFIALQAGDFAVCEGKQHPHFKETFGSANTSQSLAQQHNTEGPTRSFLG